jgi:hypothetical protein
VLEPDLRNAPSTRVCEFRLGLQNELDLAQGLVERRHAAMLAYLRSMQRKSTSPRRYTGES